MNRAAVRAVVPTATSRTETTPSIGPVPATSAATSTAAQVLAHRVSARAGRRRYPGDEPVVYGLASTDATVHDGRQAGADALDTALWTACTAEHAAAGGFLRRAVLPFDHNRRMVSVLVEMDLQVLADGVMAGRRIFANTMKYVLMGTSSNFGNMFSAAGASAFLPFLPMLPGQILLNNLLYDASQLAIPTDTVDPEQLARPARWDIGLIGRFMLVFGPISSLFDFATFAVMLFVFHAGAELFHTGWFVESLCTQTLVLFVIRTRRSPSYRSRPSIALLLAVLAAVGVGVVLPYTPVAPDLGLTPLPVAFFAALGATVVVYLVLAEAVKRWFFRSPAPTPAHPPRTGRRVQRRASRFSVGRVRTPTGVTALRTDRSNRRRKPRVMLSHS